MFFQKKAITGALALGLGVLTVACGQPKNASDQASSTANAEQAAASVDTANKDCPAPAVVIENNNAAEVTRENYTLAETQTVMAAYVGKIAKATCSSGVGVLWNDGKTADPKDRTVIRINFDTLYSSLLLDLNSPATITLPETDGRYQSAMVVNGEGYTFVYKEPGDYELTKQTVGSRFALVVFRTGVNIQDSADVAEAQALQTKLSVRQEEKGEYIQPTQWNKEQMLAIRDEYNKERNEKGVKSEDLFGRKGEITPEQNNMGVAVGIGGLPKEGAVYLFYTPTSSDPQSLTLKDVPNGDNAFWSLTVYDKDGFPSGDLFNLNSAFAKTNEAGDVVINLGGDTDQENYLGIYPGWNATFRIYNPKPAYFDGSWNRPELELK